MSLRRQHELTFQPGNADKEGGENCRRIDKDWREMAKSASDDGVEDQYAIGTLENSAENSSGSVASLLMVNKHAERPCQDWDRRK